MNASLFRWWTTQRYAHALVNNEDHTRNRIHSIQACILPNSISASQLHVHAQRTFLCFHVMVNRKDHTRDRRRQLYCTHVITRTPRPWFLHHDITQNSCTQDNENASSLLNTPSPPIMITLRTSMQMKLIRGTELPLKGSTGSARVMVSKTEFKNRWDKIVARQKLDLNISNLDNNTFIHLISYNPATTS